MAGVFLSFWNRSVAAGWLILAVIALRLVLKKAPKSTRCLLWALVGARLVFPFSVKSILSLIPSAETVPPAVLTMDAFFVSSGVAVLNEAVNESLVDFYETTEVPAGHTRSIVLACAAVWLAGIALLCLWALISWLRLRRRVAEAVIEEDGVWVCDRIASPFLLGVIRPQIYLPFGLAEESRAYVAAHERAHIRRRDHWTKPIAFLLLTAYWFHPLIWAAYALLCRDIELACDERVVRELGPESRKAYSQALLRCSVQRSALAACPLAFGEVGVKERVKNVLNYKKPAFWAAAVSLIVVIAAAVCFLTDPVAERPANPAKGPDPAPEFSNLSAGETSEVTPEYTGGALLYQSAYLSSCFSDGGGVYSSVIEDGDALIISDSSQNVRHYTLYEAVQYKPEDIYLYADILPYLSSEEEWTGRRLMPDNAEGVTRRVYERLPEERSVEGDSEWVSIWEISLPDGGKQMWIGGSGRLFALIDLREAFGLPAGILRVAALWTYDPSLPTAIPVRFDLEGEINVWTSDGGLTLDPGDGEWTDSLTAQQGQTVYWMPSREEAPIDGASLSYSYYMEGFDSRQTDSISLRPAMDYEGLYGGKTYGISQDWLGMLSSRFHGTRLAAKDGELAVCWPSISDELENHSSIGGVRLQDDLVRDAEAGE